MFAFSLLKIREKEYEKRNCAARNPVKGGSASARGGCPPNRIIIVRKHIMRVRINGVTSPIGNADGGNPHEGCRYTAMTPETSQTASGRSLRPSAG